MTDDDVMIYLKKVYFLRIYIFDAKQLENRAIGEK